MIYIFENQSNWQKYAVGASENDFAWRKLEKYLKDQSAGEDYDIRSWRLIHREIDGVYPI